MDVEMIRDYCLSFPEVTEGQPFGEGTLVFKVGQKIFLLLSLDTVPLQFNVKCDPQRAIELREEYEYIIPGYHMNKKHWNTVIVDRSLRADLLKGMIEDSYNLVKTGGKKKSK